MKNKRKLAADTCQKLGLGFTFAAFVQADNAVESIVFAGLAVGALVAAYVFTDDD